MSGHDRFSEFAQTGGVYQVFEDLVFDKTDRIYFDKETEINGNGFDLTSSILTDHGFLYVTGEDAGHSGANGRLFIKNFGGVEGFIPGADVDENLISSDSGISGFGCSPLTVGNYGYLSVESSIIQNNRGDDGSTFSGVFQVEKWGNLRLKNSIVYNNRGNTAGVIVTVGYRTLEPGDVEISETSFLKNEGTGGGGTIYVERASSLYVLSSYFRENKALSEEGGGGAIYATNETYTIVDSSTFEANFSANLGGAIYTEDSATLIVQDSSFANNSAGKRGAAIAIGEATDKEDYSSKAFIIAYNSNVVFSGNKLSDGEAEAIYLYTPKTQMYLNAWDGKEIVFDDKIVANDLGDGNKIDLFLNTSGAQYWNEGQVYTNQDSTNGTIVFNHEVENLNLHFQGGVLKLTGPNTDKGILGSSILHLDGGGVISTVDGTTKGVVLAGLNGTSDVQVQLDVDLASQTSDTFSLNENGSTNGSGSLVIDGWSILSDATAETAIVQVSDKELSDRFSLSDTGAKAQGKIYSYDVAQLEDGNFEFSRKSDAPIDVNPDIYAGDTALAGIGVVDHLINVTLMSPRMTGSVRDEIGRGANWWASLSGNDLTMNNGNFHSVDYRYAVGMLGYTTDPSHVGDYRVMYSLYGAFVDGKQEYARNDIRQNAALAGISAELARNDHWLAVHARVGYMNSRLKLSSDNKDVNTPWVGLTAATGMRYSFDAFELNPHIMGSWIYAKADDYRTSADVAVDNHNTHITELSPGLSLSANLTNDWKANLTTRYNFVKVWGDETYADNMALPEIHYDNYAEYGVGIEKFSDDWQASLRIERSSDGRQGWSGFAHVNWMF